MLFPHLRPAALIHILLVPTLLLGAAGLRADLVAPPGIARSADEALFSVVRVQSITLQRGDVADVYSPVVPAIHSETFADRFPLVAVLQGGLVDKSHYEVLGHELARLGFVAVIPNRLRSRPGFPIRILLTDVNVITDVLGAITAADADPQSTLFRIVDTDRMGLVGHSLGGAVALYAVAGLCEGQICDGDFERPSSLRAAAIYGAGLANDDGSVTDLDTSAVPVALVQGSLDGVSAPADATATYPTLEHPRALIGIAGANHYGICDENNPPGSRPDSSVPTLGQEKSVGHISRWIGYWLHAQLSDSPAARTMIYRVGRSLDGVVRVEAD